MLSWRLPISQDFSLQSSMGEFSISKLQHMCPSHVGVVLISSKFSNIIQQIRSHRLCFEGYVNKIASFPFVGMKPNSRKEL